MGTNFLEIYFPPPSRKYNDETASAPYFQAPPRLSYRSLLSATPRLCSYEPLISTVIPPNLPHWEKNVLPPFLDGAKRWSVEKVFTSALQRYEKFLVGTTFLSRAAKEFRDPLLATSFLPNRIHRRWHVRWHDLTKLRGAPKSLAFSTIPAQNACVQARAVC